jgi:hypothetical protein
MTRSSLPWWSYLVGVAWAAVLVQGLTWVVFGFGRLAPAPRGVMIATVVWGVLIGVYRAWLQWCLTFVVAAVVFAASTVVLLRPDREPGRPSGNAAGELEYVFLVPVSYGVLCILLSLAVGLGVALGWLWRRRRAAAPSVVGAAGRRRLVWLTAAGVLWALVVAVDVALGSGHTGMLWIPLVAVPAPVLVLAGATAGWGAVIGALREWAEVPAALGLGAAAAVVGVMAAGAVDAGYWGSALANSAVLVAMPFGVVAFALSVGVVAAGSVASLAHRVRRRSDGSAEDGRGMLTYS